MLIKWPLQDVDRRETEIKGLSIQMIGAGKLARVTSSESGHVPVVECVV